MDDPLCKRGLIMPMYNLKRCICLSKACRSLKLGQDRPYTCRTLPFCSSSTPLHSVHSSKHPQLTITYALMTPNYSSLSKGPSIKYVTLEGEGVRESVTVCDRGEGVKSM